MYNGVVWCVHVDMRMGVVCACRHAQGLCESWWACTRLVPAWHLYHGDAWGVVHKKWCGAVPSKHTVLVMLRCAAVLAPGTVGLTLTQNTAQQRIYMAPQACVKQQPIRPVDGRHVAVDTCYCRQQASMADARKT